MRLEEWSRFFRQFPVKVQPVRAAIKRGPRIKIADFRFQRRDFRLPDVPGEIVNPVLA